MISPPDSAVTKDAGRLSFQPSIKGTRPGQSDSETRSFLLHRTRAESRAAAREATHLRARAQREQQFFGASGRASPGAARPQRQEDLLRIPVGQASPKSQAEAQGSAAARATPTANPSAPQLSPHSRGSVGASASAAITGPRASAISAPAASELSETGQLAAPAAQNLGWISVEGAQAPGAPGGVAWQARGVSFSTAEARQVPQALEINARLDLPPALGSALDLAAELARQGAQRFELELTEPGEGRLLMRVKVKDQALALTLIAQPGATRRLANARSQISERLQDRGYNLASFLLATH